MAVIEAIGVYKTFDQSAVRVDAVCGIDLAIDKGEMVAIVGPSGSGKSTLLSLLGAIDAPTSGQVLLDGTDLANLDDTGRTLLRRHRIGIVFQAQNLIPTLSAIENVGLPLELDGVSRSEASRRASESLAMVGLSHRGHHLPGMMSGGEQQRVAVARALVIDPALLLADEPTGSLDSVSSRQIVDLLRDLVDQHQQTVVVVTHDPDVADRADRIVHLRDGVVESFETLDQPVRSTAEIA
ncbi:MAG: ABC transporter ATP-binding protein [Pirellulaceae bacterium]